MRIVIDMQGAQGSAMHRGIGRYSLSLAHAIVRNRGQHEVLLALSGFFPDTIEPIRAQFDASLPQENIFVWHSSGPVHHNTPLNVWRRKAAELVRESFLASLRPDVVYVTSLFEGWGWSNDAVTSIGLLTSRLPTAVSLYDLIPFMNRDGYIRDALVESWYENKLDQVRRAELLLAISESSRQEAIRYLGFPADKVINVGTAADPQFRRITVSESRAKAICTRYGLGRKFLMYTGGIDHRKNIEGLIRAYALVPGPIRTQHQLAIVCSVESNTRAMINGLTKELGMASPEVILTGFVDEEDLIDLYNICTAFVFPSLHEGFGLPALEAMSCGAPVIASNTSSLPEVVGRDDALFDPRNCGAIADKIVQVLTDEKYRADLRAHGPQQAKKFSWDDTAKLAIRGFEGMPANAATPTNLASRPTLAFVALAPPHAGYLVEYSGQLLRELARHYRIDVILGQDLTGDPWIKENCRVRSLEWFSDNYASFDRVLYSCSPHFYAEHHYQVANLRPGVLILHGDYQSNGENWVQQDDTPQLLYVRRALAKLPYYKRTRLSPRGAELLSVYPHDNSLIQNSLGVIVHTEVSRQAASKLIGEAATEDWSVIPAPRSSVVRADRPAARGKLGLASNAFVVCCLIDASEKNATRVLDAWSASRLSANDNCHLIILAEQRYERETGKFSSVIKGGEQTKQVTLLDDVSYAQMGGWLSIADLSLHVRRPPLRNLSAITLDCLNLEVPLIINCGVSSPFIPEDAVWKIAEDFEVRDLVLALETMWLNESIREKFNKRAGQILESQHTPRHCAEKLTESIEAFYEKSNSGNFALLKKIADLELTEIGAKEYLLLSEKLALNRAAGKEKQFLVDISELVERDAKSGIQRVVRSVLIALLDNPPQHYRVEPVYGSAKEPGYRYARKFTLAMLGFTCEDVADDLVELTAGDVFLGLDFQPQVVPHQAEYLSNMRRIGVRVYFVVYDLLPVLFPGGFPEGASAGFICWLRTVSRADGLICISEAVAGELVDWLTVSRTERHRPLKVGWFHLGADVAGSMPTRGLPDDAETIFEMLARRPTFLVVGTIEPRKGQLQTLAAFEVLWKNNVDINLVMVGKQGWMVEDLADKLRCHPEKNLRLFWLAGITDEYLERVYAASVCLIAPSEGEGFGLPLIEAAQHGLPIIARDIPVFREVAGMHAFYFSGHEPAALAEAIRLWMILDGSGTAPVSARINWLTWSGSTQQLLDVVLGGQWMTVWKEDGIYRFFAADERLGSTVGIKRGLHTLTAGKAGCLMYGPYLSLSAGYYLIKVIGVLSRVGIPAAYGDVVSHKGASIHAVSSIRSQDNGILAQFEIELSISVTDLEVRIWVAADAEIGIWRLEIIPEKHLTMTESDRFESSPSSNSAA